MRVFGILLCVLVGTASSAFGQEVQLQSVRCNPSPAKGSSVGCDYRYMYPNSVAGRMFDVEAVLKFDDALGVINLWTTRNFMGMSQSTPWIFSIIAIRDVGCGKKTYTASGSPWIGAEATLFISDNRFQDMLDPRCDRFSSPKVSITGWLKTSPVAAEEWFIQANTSPK